MASIRNDIEGYTHTNFISSDLYKRMYDKIKSEIKVDKLLEYNDEIIKENHFAYLKDKENVHIIYASDARFSNFSDEGCNSEIVENVLDFYIDSALKRINNTTSELGAKEIILRQFNPQAYFYVCKNTYHYIEEKGIPVFEEEWIPLDVIRERPIWGALHICFYLRIYYTALGKPIPEFYKREKEMPTSHGYEGIIACPLDEGVVIKEFTEKSEDPNKPDIKIKAIYKP